MITIDLIPASDYYTEHYGQLFESVTRHTVTGKNVHNRSFPHRIAVWDNTRRPNTDPTRRVDGRPVGEGRYVDPFGRGTDADRSFLLSAQSIVIAATPTERPERGETLTVGDTVQLRYPDGTVSGPMTVTSGFLADPGLIPAQ
jgi:hypothetical protein